ncbi:hypothetical protein [Haloarcula regularis]|uniref:hypothetical protein n=1 Tax=Haloarcula regularis TaxID=3033392 RepID=UPI0023E76F45|nr:hypothetical protein [Halomicroarcula sp. SYNS111]
MDVSDEVDDWPANRHANAVFTGPLEMFVGRTRTRNWHSVLDTYEIFVVFWVGMTAVTNANPVSEQVELEGFVLGTLCDSAGELQLRQWVRRWT